MIALAQNRIAMRLRAGLACSLPLLLLLPLPATGAGACAVPVIPRITHAGPNLNPQTVYLLDTSAYAGALCNDGSPGGYIFRPGSGHGVQRWIIELQGGAECEDNATCARRARSLISTKGLISGVSRGGTLDGILSTDASVNPDFYDANAVRVLYCSSDFWTGSRKPVSSPFSRRNAAATWYFRGRAIAMAVLRDLAGKGLVSATEVLLTGDSAGGVGIVLDANDLVPLAPPAARTFVAEDAGFTLDIGAFDPHSPKTGYVSGAQPTPGEIILSQGHAFWGGRGDLPCTTAATTAAERMLCYNTAYVISALYVAPPVFATEALDDLAQLRDDGLPPGRPAPGSPEAVYAAAFAQAMTTALEAAGPENSVYAPYAFIHQMFTGKGDVLEAFDTLHSFAQNDSVTPQQAVGRWYLDPCKAKQRIGTTLEPPGRQHAATGLW